MVKLLEEKEAFEARQQLEQEMRTDVLEDKKQLEAIDVKRYMDEAYGLINYYLDYYMDIPEDTRNIISLWTIGTYFHKHFNTYPYLFINAMRGSGKTRLLKLIEAFCNQGQLTTLLTEATMFRTTGTLLLDEFEGVNRKGAETLRELLNSAYKKGTKVFRMKKKKTLEGENQVVEEFQPYRPIVMANIYGMEEVLGDRCITTLIEKSQDQSKIKLVEEFKDNYSIKDIQSKLLACSSVVKCSVVTLWNVHQQWNSYIKQRYTPSTLYTYNTYNYTKLHENDLEVRKVDKMLKGEEIITIDNTELFDKIDSTKIDGRYLELFFPLFIIANEISPTILDKTLEFAKKLVEDKRVDEVTESKDVMVYSLIAKQTPGTWYEVSSLTTIFRMMSGEGENEWLNAKWLGRSLRRLSLISQKRRTSRGMEVMLNIDKAKLKEAIFKPRDEKEN